MARGYLVYYSGRLVVMVGLFTRERADKAGQPIESARKRSDVGDCVALIDRRVGYELRVPPCAHKIHVFAPYLPKGSKQRTHWPVDWPVPPHRLHTGLQQVLAVDHAHLRQ
jgi:hypothetical protein